MDYRQCWTCGKPMTPLGYNRYGEPRRWRCGCTEDNEMDGLGNWNCDGCHRTKSRVTTVNMWFGLHLCNDCYAEKSSPEGYIKAKARHDAINAADIVDNGAEIHPAGTRAELDALRERVAALEAERDAARAEAGRLREVLAKFCEFTDATDEWTTPITDEKDEFGWHVANPLYLLLHEAKGLIASAPLPFETPPNQWDDAGGGLAPLSAEG